MLDNIFRAFQLPVIDFDAESYYEMVKLTEKEIKGPFSPPMQPVFMVHTINYKGKAKDQEVTISPLLAHMTAAELDGLVETPLKADFECHTQVVERGVATTAQPVKRRKTAR